MIMTQHISDFGLGRKKWKSLKKAVRVAEGSWCTGHWAGQGTFTEAAVWDQATDAKWELKETLEKNIPGRDERSISIL